MDEQQKTETEQTHKDGYTPRPVWQVWAARIGLVVFFLFLILFYSNLFRGGL